MSQSAATKLIPKLRFKIHDRRNLKNIDGPRGRHDKIKKTLTALLKHERIELNYHRGDETRGYAERLIAEAIRNGDCHKETMEMASYWIIEPQIVHKLFKVLAPRYSNSEQSYTKLWRAPNTYPGHGRPKCILELRNNIYPPLGPDRTPNKNLIHNVLLEEAMKDYRKNKTKNAAKAASAELNVSADSEGKKCIRKANMAAMERRIIAESEARNSETKANIPSESMDDGSSKSGLVTEDSELPTKASASELPTKASASELATEEHVKTDSVSKGETKLENKLDSSLQADLNKMKINEEGSKESLSKDEKK